MSPQRPNATPPLHSVQMPNLNETRFTSDVRQGTLPQAKQLARFWLATGALVLAALTLAASNRVSAVEQRVEFGAPTVLSQQGQRLKVAVPLRTAPDDRATAAAFLVRDTTASGGFSAPQAEGFTVLRPEEAAYVVFQSTEVVDSPELSMTFSVAGDPNSPYRMDLKIPVDASGSLAALEAGVRDGAGSGGNSLKTRRVAGPRAPTNLPPK